jgi:hypothetical protein
LVFIQVGLFVNWSWQRFGAEIFDELFSEDWQLAGTLKNPGKLEA